MVDKKHNKGSDSISADATKEKAIATTIRGLADDKTIKEHEGFHFFREPENWLSLVIFVLSWFSIVVIMICFILFLFGHDVGFIKSFINSSGNGAGYLLLAVIAPALFIAAGNFKHRRGDTKSATLADKITKDVSDEL